MEKIEQLIKDFFKAVDWKYNFTDNERKRFTAGLRMGGVLGAIRIVIIIFDKSYIVYGVLNSTAEKDKYASVAEFITRANYGMQNGNFEMDYRDGEIRYKTFVKFEKSNISESVVAESILVPVFMIEKYGKSLIKVMLGEVSAEDGIAEAEETANELDDEDEMQKANN